VDKGPIVTPELAKPEKSATGELEVTMSLWVQWFKTNGNRKMYAQWVDVDIDALENIDNVIASEKDPKKLKTLTALKTWKTTSPIVQADIDLGKMLRTKERAIDVLITSTGLFRYPPLKPAKQ
jgi:hypothetical protein